MITGGAGFIGSHLCRHYVEEGCDVVCLDNLYTGTKDNITDLLDHPYFEFVRHDQIKPYWGHFDLILNFACPASPVHYQRNAIYTMKTNVLGTLNMLGLAKRCSARIVQASTSEVYGNPEVHPQPETYVGRVNPIGIRSCYDEGKRAAEALCFDYKRVHKVDVRVIRIFNTYGPNMAANDGRVVSNFITQALQGEPITIYGDGSQTRSLCYVSDLVDGIVRIAAAPMETIDGAYNLGRDEELSMKALAEEILRLTQSPSKLVFEDLPQDDPEMRRPQLDKTRRAFDWSPQVSVEDGLRKTIAYFQSLL